MNDYKWVSMRPLSCRKYDVYDDDNDDKKVWF